MLSTRDEFEIIDCYEGEITVAVTDDYVIKRDENLEESYIQHKKNASSLVFNPSTEAKLFVVHFLFKKE